MENASKALLMAAGVLLGILILSLAIYLFVSFGQTSAEINEKNRQQQIVQFNSQYTVYLGRKDLTIYDIITIVAYAKENNQDYRDEDGNVYAGQNQNIVDIFLDGTKISDGKNKSYFDRKIQEDQKELKQDEHDNWVLPTYECSDITYNAQGRVKIVNIKKN